VVLPHLWPGLLLWQLRRQLLVHWLLRQHLLLHWLLMVLPQIVLLLLLLPCWLRWRLLNWLLGCSCVHVDAGPCTDEIQ
jgi:hypothetical protein